MRKLYFVLPIFLLFLAPVMADTYSNLVSLTACSAWTPASDTLFIVGNDLDCTSYAFNLDDGGTINHMAVDLNGYTIDVTGLGVQSGGGDAQDVEVYNGNLKGNIQYNANSESGGLFFHDMTINGSIALKGGYSPMVLTYIRNVTVNLNGENFMEINVGTLTVEDTTVNCISGTCYAFTNFFSPYGVYFSTLVLQNVKMYGMTSDLSTVGQVFFGDITMINSTFIDPDNYTDSNYPSRWVFKEEATFTAKDQNNNPINAMAHIVSVTPSGDNPLKNENFHDVSDVGLNNGTGTSFITKTVYWFGMNDEVSNFNTYNVTVKARTQVSSKIITFQSPAEANFTLDFSSEDTGSDIVVDNRTVTEKGGNAITGIIAFLSPLALFLVPLLAVL